MKMRLLLSLILCLTFSSQVQSMGFPGNGPLGTWDWTFEIPDGGTMEGTMVVSKEGNEFKIVLGGQAGEYEMKELELKENKLVKGHIFYEGSRVDFSGTFTGDQYIGTITVDYNKMAWNAVRKAD